MVDTQRQTYPYLTLLFLFRAGLHSIAIEYCKRQLLSDVIDFGKDLYSKYYEKFNCQLPQSEVDHFLQRAHGDYSSRTDICREALVSLMVGKKFNSPFEDKFFRWFLSSSLDH